MICTKASALNGLQPGVLPVTPLSRMLTITAANGTKHTITYHSCLRIHRLLFTRAHDWVLHRRHLARLTPVGSHPPMRMLLCREAAGKAPSVFLETSTTDCSRNEDRRLVKTDQKQDYIKRWRWSVFMVMLPRNIHYSQLL